MSGISVRLNPVFVNTFTMLRIGFVIILIASTVSSQTTRRPTPVAPNVDRIGLKTGGVFTATATFSDTSDACTSRYSCVNCTAVRVCTPLADNKGFQELRRVNCSSTTTPYCDYETGTCTSTQTRQCALQGDFICQRDGYFPDQTSCTKFHYCHNSVSYTFTCLQSYYYYDPKSESCVYNRGCYSFSCSGKNGFKVAYSGDPSIYAYCIGNAPLVVDKCKGKDELNTTSQRCEPICKAEGLIEDSEDCTSYYTCSISSQVSTTVTYLMTHKTCPSGQAYSTTSFQCLPVAQVPRCFVGSTTAVSWSSSTPTPQ